MTTRNEQLLTQLEQHGLTFNLTGTAEGTKLVVSPRERVSGEIAKTIGDRRNGLIIALWRRDPLVQTAMAAMAPKVPDCGPVPILTVLDVPACASDSPQATGACYSCGVRVEADASGWKLLCPACSAANAILTAEELMRRLARKDADPDDACRACGGPVRQWIQAAPGDFVPMCVHHIDIYEHARQAEIEEVAVNGPLFAGVA